MIKSHLSGILGERRLKQTDLARMTGLALNTVNKFYHDRWDQLDRETLDKICTALGVGIEDLLEWSSNKTNKAHEAPLRPKRQPAEARA